VFSSTKKGRLLFTAWIPERVFHIKAAGAYGILKDVPVEIQKKIVELFPRVDHAYGEEVV